MKRMIVLRGLPGSGKTQIAELLRQLHSWTVRLDDFWTGPDNGMSPGSTPYSFNYGRIKEAVAWMDQRLARGIEGEAELIVVDNTHTRLWEMDKQIRKAERAGYRVHILHVERDLYDCVRDCSHPVPINKMLEMADRWEPVVDRDPEKRISALEVRVLSLAEVSRAKLAGTEEKK